MTDTLAKLKLPGSSITLRRATREDLPAIVGLLVSDPLGSSREAGCEASDFGPYAPAFAAIDTSHAWRDVGHVGFTASHEGFKLQL